MKNLLFVMLLSLVVAGANAQYYYLDVVGTKQANDQYQLIRNHRFNSISATSYDGNDEVTKDFVLEQTISKDGKEITTRSSTIGATESILTSYFDNNRVVKTVDSNNIASTTIIYEYDDAGRVRSITSTAKDFDNAFNTTETRLWFYDNNGVPQKMLRIKDKLDTTTVTFKTDTDKVTEEKWSKRTWTIDTYFYYYNAQGQLTDIARYNKKAKTTLPDFIFEYDSANRISQMTQAQPGGANYLIWQYTYNGNGLKTKEVVYNKKKELLGRVEYSYQ